MDRSRRIPVVEATGQPVDRQLELGAAGDRVVLGDAGVAGRAGLVVDDVDRPVGSEVEPVGAAADAETPAVGEGDLDGSEPVVEPEPELAGEGRGAGGGAPAGVVHQEEAEVVEDPLAIAAPEDRSTGEPEGLGPVAQGAPDLVEAFDVGRRPGLAWSRSAGLWSGQHLLEEALERLVHEAAPVEGRDHELVFRVLHGRRSQEVLDEVGLWALGPPLEARGGRGPVDRRDDGHSR